MTMAFTYQGTKTELHGRLFRQIPETEHLVDGFVRATFRSVSDRDLILSECAMLNMVPVGHL